jgi:hypothetical protein
MLASELKVSRVEVSLPFGELASTGLTSPVAMSTRLRTMPAAFWSPGALPAILPSSVNCVIAYADARLFAR